MPKALLDDSLFSPSSFKLRRLKSVIKEKDWDADIMGISIISLGLIVGILAALLAAGRRFYYLYLR